ncbi:GspH/FimT family protein [Legionella clemsonensis]|uniref:Type II secretion system protein H n=1 Tax=Legionella clemsonensis TaxID=1867846 RepID=A0A222P1L4_9GAMM|nr:GspH/FimT family protein [Legionella clemsonensis]ASQ45719.1 Type II transport protein GspH [Legionella clemsonensis]
MKTIGGMTLLELVCCLLLICVLFFTTVPAQFSLMQHNQLKVMEDEISNAIRYARKMALLHGVPLALTPLQSSNDWSKGMILFIDNKQHQYRSGDKLLHQWQWQKPGLQISWKGFLSNSYLLFSNNLKHAATSGHFDLFTADSKHVKLIVNRFGRVSKPVSIRDGKDLH